MAAIVVVEGLELEVIRGAGNLLREHLPVVYFEYIPDVSESRESRKRSAFEALLELGYAAHAVRLDGSTERVGSAVACHAVRSFSHDVIALPPARQHDLAR